MFFQYQKTKLQFAIIYPLSSLVLVTEWPFRGFTALNKLQKVCSVSLEQIEPMDTVGQYSSS